jgi:hypothetical protein
MILWVEGFTNAAAINPTITKPMRFSRIVAAV